MSCQFTETVSLLIDGALSNQEAAQTRSHMTACPECRLALEDFLGVREALKASPSPVDDVMHRRALNRILASGRTRLWNRRISVPAPALAGLLITLIAFGVWFVATLSRPATQVTFNQPSSVLNSGGRPSTDIGLELSRLDHGGRVVIIKAPKAGGPQVQQPGRISQ